MWRGGGRRNRDDGFDCDSCCDWTNFDDSVNCSSCENVFCSDCVGIECTGCKERDPDQYNICESCMAYPGCEACADEMMTIVFCKRCIEDHLKNCSKTSRAERTINTESHSIQKDDERIKELRTQISSIQAELRCLERSVAASKVRKADAEAELKDEEGQQSKKQEIEK